MLNKIEEIAAAKGNDKIEVMRKYPEIKKVLLYAYDPFKKYYMVDPELEGRNEPATTPYKSVYSLLTALCEREITGNTALGAAKMLAQTMSPNGAELLKRIINKDLRCGISVKTINKAFPDLVPLVFDGSDKPDFMLLKNFDPNKAVWPCLAAIKEDGVRARYVLGHFVSRACKELIGFSQIFAHLKNYPYELDGELVVPGMCFDDASGLIRNDSHVPNAVYYVFDAPDAPGNKLERLKILKETLKENEFVKIIPHHKINDFKTLMAFFDKAVGDGKEGLVYYDPFSLYEDKRSYDWMRLVPLENADCPVVGFYEGKGKNAGSLGGIIVDYKGHEVKVGTGFKEKMQENQPDKNNSSLKSTLEEKGIAKGISIEKQNIRQYIWDNKDLFMGAIAECEFKEETKKGSMRQPRFKRWRWDKS